MEFSSPWFFLLIPFLVIGGLVVTPRNQIPSFRFPAKDLLTSLKPTWKIQFSFVPALLRCLALLLMVVALTAPRQVLEETEHKTEGIDIVLAIDCSGSMAAEDFKLKGQRYNRLTIIKDVVKDFITKRRNDRIALIAFSGLAYTACPLTTDYNWLLENLERIELGVLEDGTAIGSAINSSLNRLKRSTAKSKVIILLTDGMNNAGKVNPVAAAKIAQSMKVKIYTIGAGSKGPIPFPFKDMFGRTIYQNVQLDLDENTMKEIAKITGGQYFRATDTESLSRIYAEIDSLEKTPIEEKGYKQYKELFVWFLSAAVIFLILEVLLSNTIFMRVP